jgi:amphi-Trp domain-containing protein
MGQRIAVSEELSREAVAERLRELADEFESEGSIVARTGNKTVELEPTESVAYELEVRESGSILRGNRETVTIRTVWRPSAVGATDES